MNRIIILTSLFLMASVGLAVAGVAPPVPRIPGAALKPQAPPPTEPNPAEGDDPAKIADRILQNTKDAADRLNKNDAGTDTRKKQDQTLKDIDELLKQAENQSPMGGGGASDKNDQKSQDMGGGQGGGGAPMGGGGQKGMGQSGGGGSSGQSKAGGSGKQQAGGSGSGTKSQSWRDRRQQEQRAKSGGSEPGMGEPKGLPDPTGSGQRADSQTGPGSKKDQSGGTGATAGGNDGVGGRLGKSPPTLPVDDTIAKQVWGHLPEKLRQQMSQYYKEQFMPKYDDLLRQYYASLAEREKAPKK